METEKLRECPFCGSSRVSANPEHGASASGYAPGGAVGCHSCQALGPTLFVTSDPVAAWNRRARPSGWIAVETALPEVRQRVLLHWPDGSVTFGSRTEPTSDDWSEWWADGFRLVAGCAPLRWCRIPALPSPPPGPVLAAGGVPGNPEDGEP